MDMLPIILAYVSLTVNYLARLVQTINLLFAFPAIVEPHLMEIPVSPIFLVMLTNRVLTADKV